MSMAGKVGVLVLLSSLWILVSAVFVWGQPDDGSFQQDFRIVWGDSSHVKQIDQGNTIQLMLDQTSGSGVASNNKYLFANAGARVKLMAGDSAGTVTTIYLQSDTNNTRDEIDFEFLGNRSGQPYTLQTNIYVNGKGDREQRFSLWFDPTADFHSYYVKWNQFRIVFYVDDVPIRVLRKNEAKGVPYPTVQPMFMYCTLWTADWATRGGLEKINWSKAPFNAYYRDFSIQGCIVSGSGPGPENCSESPLFNNDLIEFPYKKFQWARKNHMIYDYCQDKSRG